MQKLLSLLVFLLFAVCLSAQQPVKRYVLIEHFTNSRCGICASRNPDFFSLLAQPQNVSEVHHLAVHPKYPYSNCEFYQANTVDNDARASLYGIQGTPRVALNGTLIPASSTLLSQATLNNYAGQTSPLHLKVTETTNGSNRNVQIAARTVGSIPTGSYRLVVVVAEKVINKVTPNGESVHHNVLRDIISSGDFTPAALGSTVEVNLTYTPNTGWNAAELYALAFVQNNMTKEVLNSGTRFDPAISASEEQAVAPLRIMPNPATDEAYAQIEGDVATQVDVFSLSGQHISHSAQEQQGQVDIPLQGLPAGVYVVKITGQRTVYVGKVVKQ